MGSIKVIKNPNLSIRTLERLLAPISRLPKSPIYNCSKTVGNNNNKKESV